MLIVSDASWYVRGNCWYRQYLTNQRKCVDRNDNWYAAIRWSVRSIPPMPLLHSFTAVGQGIAVFVEDLFSLLWTDDTPSMTSSAVDTSRTSQLSIHLQAIIFFEYKTSQLPLFIFLSSSIFGICLLFLQTVKIA